MSAPNPDALKHLFGKALLERMATSLSAVDPAIDENKFQALFKQLEPLEMKPRVQLIRERAEWMLRKTRFASRQSRERKDKKRAES